VGIYAPVTDEELTRARSDPAFRQRLLGRNLEILLSGNKKLRKTPTPTDEDSKQIRGRRIGRATGRDHPGARRAREAGPLSLNSLAFLHRPRV